LKRKINLILLFSILLHFESGAKNISKIVVSFKPSFFTSSTFIFDLNKQNLEVTYDIKKNEKKKLIKKSFKLTKSQVSRLEKYLKIEQPKTSINSINYNTTDGINYSICFINEKNDSVKILSRKSYRDSNSVIEFQHLDTFFNLTFEIISEKNIDEFYLLLKTNEYFDYPNKINYLLNEYKIYREYSGCIEDHKELKSLIENIPTDSPTIINIRFSGFSPCIWNYVIQETINKNIYFIENGLLAYFKRRLSKLILKENKEKEESYDSLLLDFYSKNKKVYDTWLKKTSNFAKTKEQLIIKNYP